MQERDVIIKHYRMKAINSLGEIRVRERDRCEFETPIRRFRLFGTSQRGVLHKASAEQ